jgi:4-diphosphocytidyl-2-C-methyl-D-erythritol kinase
VRVRVPCPAKINLFLTVGPLDSRGYHPLRTVFQAVGLWDELLIETGLDKTQITCNWADLPERNTLTRTLSLLSEIAPVPPLKAHLTKHIPPQSGLGGGSSDAAGLIRGIVKLIQLPIPENELRSVAAAVGADVPFFLLGGRAKGEGYGEILMPLPDIERQWMVILRPQIGCSTPQMYGALDSMPRQWREFPAGDELYNDFERVAPCESIELIERLQVHGAEDGGLTGSGSAVFGRFNSEAEARAALARVQSEFNGQSWVVPTLTRAESLRVDTA